MTARRRRNRPKGERRLPGVFVVAGWLALLLAALSLVTWRQTRGVEMEGALRRLETERAIAEAERVEAIRRVEELQSRARVLAVARDRLGMHLPSDDEIVFLPEGDRGPDPLPAGEGDRQPMRFLASLPLPFGGKAAGDARGEGTTSLPLEEGRREGEASP